MPIQRIPRYCLLIRELKDATETDNIDYGLLAEALEELTKTAVHMEKIQEVFFFFFFFFFILSNSRIFLLDCPQISRS